MSFLSFCFSCGCREIRFGIRAARTRALAKPCVASKMQENILFFFLNKLRGGIRDHIYIFLIHLPVWRRVYPVGVRIQMATAWRKKINAGPEISTASEYCLMFERSCLVKREKKKQMKSTIRLCNLILVLVICRRNC